MTLSITLVIFQMFCFFNKVETTRNLRWSTKLGDELETCLVPSNSMDPKCREPLKSSRLWALAGREKNANLLRLDFWWNGGARHCPCTVHLHDRRSSEPHAPDPPIYFSYWLPSGSSFVAGNRKKMAIHQTTAGHRMKIRTYGIIVGATNSVHQRHTKCWWGISKYMTFTNGYGRACVSRSPRYFSGYSSVIDWVPGTF